MRCGPRPCRPSPASGQEQDPGPRLLGAISGARSPPWSNNTQACFQLWVFNGEGKRKEVVMGTKN